MFSYNFDVRQAHADRLEDAGVIKYGDRANSMPKAQQGTMRSRILRQVSLIISTNNR